jgi:heterodisulfide reductase subunit B
VDRDAFVFAAIRNLALAERDGLDVIAPCKCCYGNLRHAARFMDEDAALRARVNALLAEEGLAWRGRVEVIHLLTVLARVVGPDALAAAAVAPRTGLRVAASYGCHALRPSDVTRFDNPFVPTLFETLVRATGAEPVDWSRRLECCGDPLLDANAPLSDRIARGKIGSAREAGADAICTACPHCHVRLADAQARAAAPVAGSPPSLPLILYPQLLGLAMGISRADLGLE